MAPSAQTADKATIAGMRVPPKFVSTHGHGAFCAGDDHHTYFDERVLREGSRVRVAAIADDSNGDWKLAELRCAHCPLSIDSSALVPDFGIYNSNHVIVADATLSPWPDGVTDLSDDYVLSEPDIIHSRRNIRTA